MITQISQENLHVQEEIAKLSKRCPNSECNKMLIYSSKDALARSIRESRSCRSCSTIARNKLRLYSIRDKNAQWKGYKDIPFNWFSKYFLRKRGKKKVIRTGTITIKDTYDMWIEQDKKCALSNLPICFYDDGINHTCS